METGMTMQDDAAFLTERRAPTIPHEGNRLARYLTITSTRLFLARPAAVLLLAIGSLSP